MAPSPMHLGTDQIQRIEQPSTLVRTGQHHRRHAVDTNYQYYCPGADLQKWTGAEPIYTGPDVAQNQYQHWFQV